MTSGELFDTLKCMCIHSYMDNELFNRSNEYMCIQFIHVYVYVCIHILSNECICIHIQMNTYYICVYICVLYKTHYVYVCVIYKRQIVSSCTSSSCPIKKTK